MPAKYTTPSHMMMRNIIAVMAMFRKYHIAFASSFTSLTIGGGTLELFISFSCSEIGSTHSC